jgi:hypothetical protein
LFGSRLCSFLVTTQYPGVWVPFCANKMQIGYRCILAPYSYHSARRMHHKLEEKEKKRKNIKIIFIWASHLHSKTPSFHK